MVLTGLWRFLPTVTSCSNEKLENYRETSVRYYRVLKLWKDFFFYTGHKFFPYFFHDYFNVHGMDIELNK